MWSVTLRPGLAGSCFTDSSRSLRGYTPRGGEWKRDVDSNPDREAYETSRVANLPAIGWEWKLVDRRGFAPRVAAPASMQLALRGFLSALARNGILLARQVTC